MRKIETREQIEKKRKRNQLLIGIILVGLMILSTGGYAIMNNESNSRSSKFIKYNGVKFYSNGGYWVFTYNGQSFSTEFNPNETTNIFVPIVPSLNNYKGKVLYFDTESGEPNNEIYKNLYPIILKTNGACLSETCKKNLPIKDCGTDNIIIVKEPVENESEGISRDRNCVFINAQYNNQTKFVDAFLFKLLGI